MNMMTFNAESLSVQLGRPIADILVVICKNDIAGLEPQDMAKIIGVPVEEIQEAQGLEDYKDIRLILGAAQASSLVDRDYSWDGIETTALKGLAKQVAQSRDPEFLLKAAAIANKAQRRMAVAKDNVLDPSNGAARVPLRLTERLIRKMNANGDLTQITERQISVLDGTARNPSFASIDKALGVRSGQSEQAQNRLRLNDEFDYDSLGMDPPE